MCIPGSGPAREALVTTYRRQAWLGVTLMAAQAFCYNAVFFTYALVLTRFYGISSGNVGLFMLPFAIGNFLGPAGARAIVRYRRAADHDHRDLRGVRGADGADRLDVRDGLAGCGAADLGLDGDLLRCLGRREFGVPDRRGKFSSGGARYRHRAVLCVRDWRWRGYWAGFCSAR